MGRHRRVLILCALLAGLLQAADWPPARAHAADEAVVAAALARHGGDFEPERPTVALIITSITEDSQAHAIGLVPGDLVVGLDEWRIGARGDNQAFNERRIDQGQILHWYRPGTGPMQAGIETGKVGFNSDPTINWDVLARRDDGSASTLLLLAARTWHSDPAVAEAALARHAADGDPTDQILAWRIWHLIDRTRRGVDSAFPDWILAEGADLPQEIRALLVPFALEDAYHAARRDIAMALRQQFRGEDLPRDLLRAAAGLPIQNDPRPLADRVDRSLDRRASLVPNADMTRFSRLARLLIREGACEHAVPANHYFRIGIDAPAMDFGSGAGHRVRFDARIRASGGEKRFPSMLWLHIRPDERRQPALWVKLLGESKDVVAVDEPGDISLRRARATMTPEGAWHHLEIWMHERRLEIWLDGVRIKVVALTRPVSAPSLILHVQSSRGSFRGFEWSQFTVRD